jgi:predicted ArsR family transcriptional regulator
LLHTDLFAEKMTESPHPELRPAARARLLGLLRQEPRTVDDLADALGVTRNAVRVQLATLERDGLVRAAGFRPSLRRPARTYAVTPEAEVLLSRLYAPVALSLVRELAERMEGDALRELFRAVGRRLAAELPNPRGDLPERARAVSALLNELGGLTEVEATESEIVLRGYACPLAAIAAHQPGICAAVEALVEALLERPAEERCDRSGAPKCRFVVTLD